MHKAETNLISQCTPHNRRWDETHQKCDDCKKHEDVPRGPNYKKKDDPAVSRLRNDVNAHGEDSVQDAEVHPRAPSLRPSRTVRSTADVDEHNGDKLSMVSEGSNSQKKRKFAYDKGSEELRQEASLL